MSVLIAKDHVREPLHVVVPLQNPWRWKSRYKHMDRAIKHLHDSGAVITLVEQGFNRRELVYADSGLDGMAANCALQGAEFKHRYIGLHSASELWLKENLIGVGVQDVTSRHYDWNQIAWIDGDVHFVRPNWVGEAIHKLQHGTHSDVAFLQMFSQAADLGPNYEILPAAYPHAQGVGFVHAWKEGTLKPNLTPQIQADLEKIGGDIQALLKDFMKMEEDLAGNYYGQDAAKRVWPGLAWACTRNAWNAVGGLMDFAVWGGSDYATSHALIGARKGMIREDLHPNYKSLTDEWADRADRFVRRNLLVMDGTILHHWHGRKISRGYNAKHALLARYAFDPIRHLKRDAQGLYMLHDDGSEAFVQFRDQFRKIAIERNEDSPETGLGHFAKQGH
jgi:hypothetical protein